MTKLEKLANVSKLRLLHCSVTNLTLLHFLSRGDFDDVVRVDLTRVNCDFVSGGRKVPVAVTRERLNHLRTEVLVVYVTFLCLRRIKIASELGEWQGLIHCSLAG